jgi:hypothetical protein
MSTTAFIAEILVTGFFSTIWIFILIIQAFNIQIMPLSESLLKYKDFSTILILILLIIWYQIGWLINNLGTAIIDAPFGFPYRNKYFKENKLDYNIVRETFYQYSSADLKNDLGLDRTIIRLARGGIINFSLIFITLLPFGGVFVNSSLVFLFLAIGSCFQWRYRYKRYYKRMITSYKMILANPS